MKDKMMICPKAKDLSCKAEDRHSCPRATPHEYDYTNCCGGSKFCPPCVQTEPQPATCPDLQPEQPTPTMPLREQLGRLLCEIDNAGCLRINACNPLNCPLTKSCLDALESAVEAHDSASAAQARKRTLKYVEATLERAFVNLSPIEQGVLNICLAHIRAMAGGGR